jgi:integrase/recombinase XerD
MKIQDLLEDFKKHLESRGFSPRTINTYVLYADLFDRYLKRKGMENIENITRNVIDQYQIDISTKNEYMQIVLSTATRIGRLIGVMSFFRFLTRKGLISIDPTAALELPRLPKRPPPQYLTYREILAILRVVDTRKSLGLRDRAILELLYSVGLRNSELRFLTITSIDFNDRTIRILGKGQKERVVPIGTVALNSIQKYIQKSRPFLLRNPTNILFLSKRGKTLSIEALPDIVHKYKAKTSITKKIGAHTFRHSFATHLLLRVMDLRSLQELMGHNSIETTQIYTHLDLRDLKRAYSKAHPRK